MLRRTKEDIIKELKKCFKENGNKTPSEKIFYETTEVKITDRRKFWPNYGELVREAGLTPNKFDKTKYTSKQLCKMFVGIMRDKHTWPTRGLLDVKHNEDLNFPDSSTFYNKLGLAKKLAGTILDFVGDKRGYDDVIKICNLAREKFKANDKEVGEDLITGFVYLGKQHGRYKIGKTKNLYRRREDITLMGSEEFDLLHWIETDDMGGIEAYWHTRFKQKWIRGEWFKLSPSDIKVFKRWPKKIG